MSILAPSKYLVSSSPLVIPVSSPDNDGDDDDDDDSNVVVLIMMIVITVMVMMMIMMMMMAVPRLAKVLAVSIASQLPVISSKNASSITV